MGYNNAPQRPQIRFGSGWTPVVKTFVIVNVGVFVLQSFWPGMSRIFGLVPEMLWTSFTIWQPVTFNLLHANIMHILFNMLIFYMFAPELERMFGRTRFIGFLLVTGIGAGLCTAVASPSSIIPTIGASGIVFGVMLVYAVYFPNRQVLFMLIFPMKIKWMLLILAVIEFWYFVGGGNPGVAHVAHLGGMGFGYLYLRYDKSFFRLRDMFYRRKLKRLKKKYEVIDGGKSKNDDQDDKPRYVN